MPFYRLDKDSSLKAYYRVFILVWPALFVIPFFVLLILVLHVSWLRFIGLYFLCTGLAILVGAPLFHWARKRSEFAKDPRPVILASGLTVLSGMVPLVYFLVRPMGLDPVAALGAGCVAVIPWVALCLRPPKKLYERLRSRRSSTHSHPRGSDT